MSVVQFEDGEKIIKIVRRHYFVLLPMIFFMLLALFLPVVVNLFLTSDFLSFDPKVASLIDDFFREWQVFIYSIWFLLIWVVFFIEWTDFYLDVWIITDRRIIDVEQKGFFHREVTSFRFAQIQDITVETRGIVETFFRFGTLHIQTAGHNRNIIIPDAHYPEDARVLILKLAESEKQLTSQK